MRRLCVRPSAPARRMAAPRLLLLRRPVPVRSYSDEMIDPFSPPPVKPRTAPTTKIFRFQETVDQFWRAASNEKWVLAATHFDKLRRNAVPPADVYNKMLEHSARFLPLDATQRMYEDMMASGVQPDLNTYKTMINTLGARRELPAVIKLVGEMKEKGLELSDAFLNELIMVYLKCHRLDLALAEYDFLQAEKRHIEPRAYGELVEVLAAKGNPERAIEIFHQCKASDPLLVPTRLYPIMLSLYIRRNKGSQALQLFSEMRQRFQPSQTQTLDVIKLLSRSGMVKETLEVLEAMNSTALPRPDAQSYGEVIHMLCRANEPQKAVQIVEEMKKNEVVPRPGDYEVIIEALLRENSTVLAFELLQEMHSHGFKLSSLRFCVLLKMLAKNSDLHRCNVMDAMAKSHDIQYDKGTFAALIACAAKKRDLSMAIQHINNCSALYGQSPNWYNAAFSEYAYQGVQDTALLLLAEMQRAGIEPNEVTYQLFITLGDTMAAKNLVPGYKTDPRYWLDNSPDGAAVQKSEPPPRRIYKSRRVDVAIANPQGSAFTTPPAPAKPNADTTTATAPP